MSLGEVLPGVNAGLNATSGLLILAGWRAIKAGRRDLHKKLMLAAVTTSALFLVCYLTRVYLTGTHRFVGDEWLRITYLVVLFSHMFLAMLLVPMVIAALTFALRGRFVQHRKVVRFAFPTWLYVSATGVIVYVMLYHLGSAAPVV